MACDDLVFVDDEYDDDDDEEDDDDDGISQFVDASVTFASVVDLESCCESTERWTLSGIGALISADALEQ